MIFRGSDEVDRCVCVTIGSKKSMFSMGCDCCACETTFVLLIGVIALDRGETGSDGSNSSRVKCDEVSSSP